MTYSTEQRNILFSFLQSNPDTQFTAKQIENALSSKNISRSAVYRNLSELENEGIIKRCSKAGTRETFYQYIDSKACKNHIHLSCTKCGKISHLEHKTAELLVSDVSSSEGFKINVGETTLFGICKNCALSSENLVMEKEL